MNNLEAKKLLIFDCDGVLFNSDKANVAYFMHCMHQAGYNSVPENLSHKITYMAIGQLIQEITNSPEEAKRIFTISQTIPYEPFLADLEPCCNFEEIFTRLRQNFFLAVASNRGRSLVKVFRHFNLFKYFHFKISTIEAKPKPDPDMLLTCVDYFDVKKEESLFIGDAVSDYQAAQNCGMDFLWVGNESEERNIRSVADLCRL